MKQSTATVPALTIGIDLSDDMSTFCAVDAAGDVVLKGTFPTTRPGVAEAFGDLASCRVVLEASTQTPWVTRELQELGHEVIVANPRNLHLISKSARKTDANDANTLARIGRVDPQLLSPVVPRDEQCLAARALMGARKKLVQTRTGLISMVRAECKVHGERIGNASSEAFARRARPQVPELLRLALDPVLDTLDELTRRIRDYDKEIEKLCEQVYPKTGVLRQVRGVGALVALAYVTTIGDPTRFRDSRTVGAYVGLVPRSYQSGKSDPKLRITKQGDPMLRTLLVNAATHIMRQSAPDCALKRLGRRIANRGNPRDRARARIAVARKLSVILHRLLLTGEVYDPMRDVIKTA